MSLVAETAQRFHALGVATIPVVLRDKRPALAQWRQYQRDLPAEEQLAQWFDRPNYNIGVITGWHGLTVLDFDQMASYRKWLRWAKMPGRRVATHAALAAYRVATGRGVHVYVWLARPERNRHLPEGIDIKGQGGYVLGEGSIHPSGAVYTALTRSMVIPRVQALGDLLPAALLLRGAQPAQVAPWPPVAGGRSNVEC